MKRVSRIAGTAICIACVTSALHGQSLFESSQSGLHENLVSKAFSLGGFLQSASYLSSDPGSDQIQIQSVYARMGLLMDASAAKWADAHGEIRFRYGNEYGESIQEVELREAWVNVSAGPFSLRTGKLVSPWGKGSVFNPVDKLTPKDPLVRSPEEDDMHMGIWAMEGSLLLGRSMKFTATWNPFYRPGKLIIDQVPMPAYVHFLPPDYPSMEFKEGSYGLKYDIHSRLADLSLYWFQGFHTWPGIAFGGFAMDSVTFEPLELALMETAYRIRMAGLDFSLPVGNWILRGEGSWMESQEPQFTREYIPFPELSYSAEIEHAGNTLNMIAGYHGKYIIDHVDMTGDASLEADMEAFLPLIQLGMQPSAGDMDAFIAQKVGAFNRLYNYQVEEFYHDVYAVARISLFHENLEVRLPVIAYLNTREWVLQPGLTFRPADGLAITAGYMGMFGPDDSLLDLVGPSLNAAYLAIKLSF